MKLRMFRNELHEKVEYSPSSCDAKKITAADVSSEKSEEIARAEQIAGRYAVEAERETRPAYKANLARIAASYRQLAEEVAS